MLSCASVVTKFTIILSVHGIAMEVTLSSWRAFFMLQLYLAMVQEMSWWAGGKSLQVGSQSMKYLICGLSKTPPADENLCYWCLAAFWHVCQMLQHWKCFGGLWTEIRFHTHAHTLRCALQLNKSLYASLPEVSKIWCSKQHIVCSFDYGYVLAGMLYY